MGEDYKQRYESYCRWHDKIVSIGSDIVQANGTIDSRRSKLNEEYAEIRRSIDNYFNARDKHKDEFKDDLISELGDIINVAAIQFSVVNEVIKKDNGTPVLIFDKLPLEVLVKKMVLMDTKYGTQSKINYNVSKQYSEEQYFKFWSQQMRHIAEQRVRKSENLTQTMNVLYENLAQCFHSIIDRVDQFSKFKPERYYHEVVESLGDIINMGAIMMATLDVDVPFENIYQKLLAKDQKNKTGGFK